MKRIIFITLFLFFSTNITFSKDVIVTIKSNEIDAKVIDIKKDTIYYYEYVKHQKDYSNNTIHKIDTSNIYMIFYDNGDTQLFMKRSKLHRNEGNYFMFAYGTGIDYGLIGIKAQWSMFGNKRIGYFIGAGPNIIYSGYNLAFGLKYYYHNFYYISCSLNNEINAHRHDNVFDDIVPTITFGADWTVRDPFFNNSNIGFNIGIGLLWDNTINKVFPALQIGFFTESY